MKGLIIWIALLALSGCASLAYSNPTTELAANYSLRGVMEMGSQLRLEANGTFEANLFYGAADGYAKGTWKQANGQVVLSPSKTLGLGEIFRNMEMRADGFCLRVELNGSNGCYLRNVELPYDAWSLGFFAPNYMEVWIETADVVDVRERVFRRAVSGVAAIQTPKDLQGDPTGWPERIAGGKGKYVRGADLPRLVYVRWQSLAEPQTYEAYIVVPEATRRAMVIGEKAFCQADAKWITGHRERLTVGLAPGGIAKVWLKGPCLPPIEVTRVQGEIVKKGPYGGTSEGKHRPLSETSKAYIEKYGIPYGSW